MVALEEYNNPNRNYVENLKDPDSGIITRRAINLLEKISHLVNESKQIYDDMVNTQSDLINRTETRVNGLTEKV